MTSDRQAFEQFRARQRRLWYTAWALSLVICVGAVFEVGSAWSYLAGFIAAAALALTAYEALVRWNRARWLRHFPELRTQPTRWILSPGERPK